MNYIKLFTLCALVVVCVIPVFGASLDQATVTDKAIAVTKATGIQLAEKPNLSVVSVDITSGSLNWNYDHVSQLWTPHVEYTTEDKVATKQELTLYSNTISKTISDNTDIKYELFASKVKETITIAKPAKRVWYKYDINVIQEYFNYNYYFPNKTEIELLRDGKMQERDLSLTNGSEIRQGVSYSADDHKITISTDFKNTYVINDKRTEGGLLIELDNSPVIFYQKPYAIDANGKRYEMDFVLDKDAETLDVVGDLNGATYPVKIDPTGNIVKTYTTLLANQTVVMWIYSGTGENTSWTVPDGVYNVSVSAVGGGGGGAGVRGGGGGSGGYTKQDSYAAIPGNTWTIYVGAGGANGTNYGDISSHGQHGESSFVYNGTAKLVNITGMGGGGGGSVWNTTGGNGGSFGYSGGGGGGAVGAAGVPGDDGSGFTGHNGGHGFDGGSYGAGGGGGQGGNAADGTTSIGGAGGAGVTLSPDGTSRCYAAGGGGGWDSSSTDHSNSGCGVTSYGYGTGNGSSAGGSGEPNTGGGGGGGGNTGAGSYSPGGDGASGFITITYMSPTPIANFTMDVDNGTFPLTVSFTDTSTLTPTSWNWSFGDGFLSTSQNPTHTYSSGGNYTVNLSVSNDGGYSSKIKYITVWNTTTSGFTANQTSGLFNLPITFNVTNARDNATMWNWSFGDGYWQNGTSQNATHVYSTGGSYTVKEITNNTHATNTTTLTNYIIVYNTTTSAFSGTPRTGNITLPVQFTGVAGNGTTYRWDFGDGNTTGNTTLSPLHVYTASGNFSVNFSVSNGQHTNWTNYTNYINATDLGSSTVTWGANTYPLNTDGYVVYQVNLSYWDLGSYTYMISIYDLAATLKTTKSITNQTGAEAIYLDSATYSTGYLFAYLSRTQITPGSEPEVIAGPSQTLLTDNIVINGYVVDSENGNPLTANVSITQGGVFNNSIASALGYYTTYPTQFVSGSNVTFNVTKTGYRQYTYSWLPATSKTYSNTNVSLVPVTPTYSGAAIGGVFLKKPYGTPISGVTVYISNATWSTTNVTNPWGYYRFDNLVTGSNYNVYGTKSGYSVSPVYVVGAV